MAKEKGTEEVVVHDVDAEFDLETNIEDAPEVKPTEQEETATEKAPEAPEEEKVSDQADTTVKTEKTWADLGVGDFVGKSNEEIAKAVLQQQKESEFRNKVYGDLSGEVGELRKYKAEQEAKAVATSKEKKEVSPLEQLSPMSEGEILDFNKIYEEHPVKALLKYGSTAIKQMIGQELQVQREGVERFVGESIEAQRDSIAFTNFLGKHDDAEKYRSFMQMLDSEQYLGLQKRPYEDLYGLARLAKAKDPSYDPTYQLMARHGSLTFEEAKLFAKQKAGSEEQATEKHQEVQKEIDKIDSVNSSTAGAGRKSDTNKKMVTVDEEFEI